MLDAALARTYEIYRTACGLRKDGLPRPATMQHFWEVWEECRRRLEQSGEHVALDERLSKKWENYWSALCLHFAYYNCCRIHLTVLRVTPAMQAGITDRVWGIAELLTER
jgi:hypothetical protein